MKAVRLVLVAAIVFVGACSTDGGEGGTGGTAGTGGTGGSGGTTGQVFPCTEQGLRDAIAVGGGPHTFDCDGPTTVVTEAEIAIDNDVILDSEGNLTVDGDDDHRVFSVPEGVAAELRGLSVRRGRASCGLDEETHCGGGIDNVGTLTLTNSTVLGNTISGYGGGIGNVGTLTLTNSTVSGNTATPTPGGGGGGIVNAGTLTLTNSTVSGNTAAEGGGIWNGIGTLMLINSTVANNAAGYGSGISAYPQGTLILINTLVDNGCEGKIPTSGGHNIESPGDSCGFDQPTDQVNVSAEQLALHQLTDNGGPTETHALGAGSVAIDVIPEEDCVGGDGGPLTTDQRGFPRPVGDGCDVGAFEVQLDVGQRSRRTRP